MPPQFAYPRLSPREAAVLAALMEGSSIGQIADQSFVSTATVRTQVRAIHCKLGTSTLHAAVAKAYRHSWSPHLN